MRPTRQLSRHCRAEDAEAQVQVEPSQRPNIKRIIIRVSGGTQRDIADDGSSDNNGNAHHYNGQDIRSKSATGDPTIQEKHSRNHKSNENRKGDP